VSEVEQVERQVEKLSAADLAKFRAWFLEFDARVWDAQIESDLKAGKLQDLIAEALADYKPARRVSFEFHDAAGKATSPFTSFAQPSQRGVGMTSLTRSNHAAAHWEVQTKVAYRLPGPPLTVGLLMDLMCVQQPARQQGLRRR
jgi:hypothetical protein